jgi:hypothetical protein
MSLTCLVGLSHGSGIHTASLDRFDRKKFAGCGDLQGCPGSFDERAGYNEVSGITSYQKSRIRSHSGVECDYLNR